VADNKQRTAGGDDRKTAAGVAGDSKGQQVDASSVQDENRSRSSQQDLSGNVSQQGGADGQNPQSKDGGTSPQSGPKPRSNP